MNVVFSGTLTDLQRHEFLERHIGRTVIWQGSVGGVSETLDRTISVLLATPGPSGRYLAFLEFAPEYKAALVHLNRDTEIKVVCRLKEWGAQAQLDRCKLLRVLSDADLQPSASVPLPP